MSNETLFNIRFWEQLAYTLIFVLGFLVALPAAWKDRNTGSVVICLSWLSITFVNLARLIVIPLNIFYAEQQPLWLPWFLHVDALALLFSIICVSLVIHYRRSTRISQQIALLSTPESELLKRLEEERQKNLTLQRLNEDLKHFAYAAAHDLHSPLRAILGFVEILSRELKDSPSDRVQMSLKHIVDGARKLMALIDALAVYNRVEIQPDGKREVDLVQLISVITQDLDEELRQKGTRVEIKPIPPVWGDPDKLYHVFLNLIGNAAKFDAKEIIIAGSQNREGVTITVTDNGIGIAPEYHEKIFKIFQKLHLEEEYSGTGIGLAIVSKIVKQHGGEVTVESEEGKGARFSVFLPGHNG